MSDFLLYSVIASVAITALLNIVPRLFPGIARKAEQSMRDQIDAIERGDQPKVKVFFPWKAMLIISLLLTVLLNLSAWFGNR